MSMDKEFASAEEAATHWRTVAQQLTEELAESKQSFEEFKTESHELESELEKLLGESEQKVKTLTADGLKTTREFRNLQDKHASLKEQLSSQIRQLEDTVTTMKTREDEMRSRIRVLEQSNDDIEREERVTQTSLSELESKYSKTLERNVLLEQELEDKSEQALELQRLKDDLRDTVNELEVYKRMLAEGSTAPTHQPAPKTPAKRPNNGGTNSSADAMDGVTPGTPATPGSKSIASIGSASASSVVMVQEMIQRIKNMETRLASCRSIVAPLIAPPTTY